MMAKKIAKYDLVYFGDSLSDDGNLYDLTSQTLAFAVPPDAQGYARKFTNGDVWPQRVAAELGAETYLNYAIGGAEAVGGQTLGDYLEMQGLDGFIVDWTLIDTDINLSAQVDRFLADTSGQDLSDVTASVLIGSVDFLNFQPSVNDPDVIQLEAALLIQQMVDSVFQSVTQLLAAGVAEVVVNTIPPAAFFPIISSFDPGFQFLAGQAFAAYNQALKDAVDYLASTDANVRIIDVEVMAQEIVDDPETFGFIADLNDSVLVDLGGDLSDDPFDFDQVAFFDEVHPTAEGHAILGMFQARSMDSEVLIADADHNDLCGSQGDDLVLARGGNDSVTLFAGDDVAFGGLGDDTLDGGRDDDILAGGSGDDDMIGGAGNDVLAGGSGDDNLSGGNGDDLLIDALGSDIAFGGNGDDVFLFTDAVLIGGEPGGNGSNTFNGGRGFDTLYLALAEETRAVVEDQLAESADMVEALSAIGISVEDFEAYNFVDSRMDLAHVETSAYIDDANLWGLC